MNAIDKLALLASLAEESCELNHGPNTSHIHAPAVNYIVQPFGYSNGGVECVSVRDMVIPICLQCATALRGNDWTLLYCFECNSSQWISRRHARMR